MLYLALKKEDVGIHGITTGIIKRCLREPYAHSELIFPDGKSFSASGWDNRVRFKQINYSHPQWWDFYHLPYVSIRDLNLIHQKAKAIDGCKYDFRGVFYWFIIKNKFKQDMNRWWCFEACSWALGQYPYRVSGVPMLEKAIERGAVKVSAPYPVILQKGPHAN